MACKYREGELCKWMQRPCFGAKHDKDGYTIDAWVEKACPAYKDDGKSAPLVEPPSYTPKKEEECKVVIRIFGPDKEKVDGDYVIVRSVKEDAMVLEDLLNRRYEGGIKVEGIGITSKRIEDFPEVKEYIARGEQFIVTINDRVKIIGDISLPLIKRELEELGLKRIT
jgi:hypothetical protein